MRKLVFLQILLIGLFFTSFSYANEEVDQFITQLLQSEGLNNDEIFNQLDSYLKQSIIIDNLKRAEYYHVTSRWFYAKRDYYNALKVIEEAILLKRKNSKNAPEDLKKSLYNKGRYQIAVNNIFGSISSFKELIALGAESKLTAKAYAQFGDIYRSLGDLNKAIENFEKAERYFKSHQLLRDLYKNHLNMSRTYAELDRLKFGSFIEAHLKSVDSISKYTKAKIDIKDLMITNNTLGNLNIELHNYDAADSYLNKALIFAKQMKNSSSNIATILNNQARSYIDQKRFKEALAIINQALNITEDSSYERALVKSNLALYYRNQLDFEKAEIEYLKAIKIVTNSAEKFPTLSELQNTSHKKSVLELFNNLAKNYVESYAYKPEEIKLTRALKAIEQSDILLDELRLNTSEVLSKLFWRNQSTEVYMLGVKIAYLLNNVEKAFYFMEKNKVLLLLEDISQQERKLAFNIPHDVLEREFVLEQAIVKAQLKIHSSTLKTQTLKDSLKNKLFKLKNNLDTFKDSLKLRFPDYAAIKRDIKILNTSDINKSFISNKEVLLEYILDANDGYLFFKSLEYTKLFKLDNVKQLNASLLQLKEAISEPFVSEEAFKNFNNLSQSIFKTIFKGVNHEDIQDKKLIVIPDYYLSYIPFEVLQYKTSANSFKPNYLLDRCDISYLFSLSFQERNNEVFREPSKNLLAMAPVVFKNKKLMALENSKYEIEELSRYYNGEIFTNEAATKASFIKEAGQYNIIHLATHADFDKNNNTFLWFQDEKLSYIELHGIKTQADLVVLSACKTMQGELVKGEGLMSLTRGFFSNGSKSVLSSLWNVNDKSNHNLMISFYKNLKQNLSKDKALANAKRAYIKSNFGMESSPYYWASNVITGNTEAIKVVGSTLKTTKNVLILLGSTLFLLIIFKRVKKNWVTKKSLAINSL